MTSPDTLAQMIRDEFEQAIAVTPIESRQRRRNSFDAALDLLLALIAGRERERDEQRKRADTRADECLRFIDAAAVEYKRANDAEAERDAAVREAATLRETLTPLVSQAQWILDVLASGSEPYASTGYGYEHMGDYTRDVRPLCEALVALAAAAPAETTR